MSSWGAGVKQSDEFMDVYDEFFERYKDDAAAIDVSHSILSEYQKEFPDEDTVPLLYTVYYALAWCLWECGVKDETLWQKIKDIIDSDADLKFWNELGVEPQIENRRRRELQKFWEKINSTPQKIKKAKKTQKKREPTLHKGDLYAYGCENGYRVALVLDFLWDSYLTAISEDIFDHVPTEGEAMCVYTHTLSWFSSKESIPKKDRIVLSNLNITDNFNNRAGLLFSPTIIGCSNVGRREYFFDLSAADPCMEKNRIGRYQMSEVLNPKILPKYAPRVDADLL